MNQTLNTESLMQISLFEKLTKAKVKDVFQDSFSQLTFCVEEGQLFTALGKNASKIKKIDQLFKKKVRVIEFNSKIEEFVKNLCYPNKISSIEFKDEALWDSSKKVVTIIPADIKSRGYIIGKAGSNLRNIETISKRYFTFDEIKVGQVVESKTEEKLAEN